MFPCFPLCARSPLLVIHSGNLSGKRNFPRKQQDENAASLTRLIVTKVTDGFNQGHSAASENSAAGKNKRWDNPEQQAGRKGFGRFKKPRENSAEFVAASGCDFEHGADRDAPSLPGNHCTTRPRPYFPKCISGIPRPAGTSSRFPTSRQLGGHFLSSESIRWAP